MQRRWVGLVIIAAMLVFSAAVWSRLPDQVPTHWDMRGEVDGWQSRTVGGLLAPGIALLLWLLLPVLRRVDPRRTQYEKFDETFRLLINLLVLFMAGVHVLSLGVALGWPLHMPRSMLAVVGLMFATLGNYLPRVRSNWWMGIRTPWTLESETVWRATHRLAGRTFVIGGLVCLVAALLPVSWGFGVAMAGIGAAALVPVVYSYVAFRRERAST